VPKLIGVEFVVYKSLSFCSSSLYIFPSRLPITLAFSMLESLCHDNTFPSTKAIMFPLSSRKDIDTRFFLNQVHIKHSLSEHSYLFSF
jgi:hypothetical protein